MTKQVTMKDIAGKLGVSIVTVSKALAGKEGVSDDLRAKIIDKAKELGYQGSSRKNAQKGSGVSVVILVAERYVSERSFYAKIYQKMVMELSAAGYIGILEIVRRESEEEGILPVSLNKDVASQCVMIGEMRPGYIEKVLGTGVKLIFFDFLNEEFDVDAITGDNINGAYALTGYLVKRGYRRIAFVGSYKATRSILDRLMGFMKYLLAKDIEIINRWILPDRDKKGNFIEMHLPVDMPEAFLCSSDEAAFRLIETLQKYGYKVPENIAVTGFDDHAEHVVEGVELTTWHVDIDSMIHHCINIIKKRTEDPEYRQGNVVVKGYLVERGTTR